MSCFALVFKLTVREFGEHKFQRIVTFVFDAEFFDYRFGINIKGVTLDGVGLKCNFGGIGCYTCNSYFKFGAVAVLEHDCASVATCCFGLKCNIKCFVWTSRETASDVSWSHKVLRRWDNVTAAQRAVAAK